MKIENKDKKLNQLHQLIEQFEYNEKIYKSGKYDEANTRVDFIDKFFEILDWDVRNTSGYSEAYRDVVREDKVIIKGKPKAPDYSFRIGGVRKFFVEAKRPSINIKEDIEPAFQIRRYSYTAKLPLSILTDFEELAVYDTRIKPSKTDKASAARINYILYKKYPEEFDFIYSTFSKPAILKGSFDKYIEDTKRKRGTSEVDKEFLKMIDGWRTDLARNIALRNKQLDINDLNYAIQKIIDRIIFLRIAEDRQMESYGTLQIAGKSNLAYQKISHLFRKANDKYNSGLFKVESWLETLIVDDKIICSLINSLYYPECPYELSVMPIEILGNIYEQFLGKTIRLTPSHQAKIEEKPEVRKAGGVYYTPKYIVDYIVENTVDEKIKRKTPKQIEKLKMLDPACGSGSFLVGAYQHLINYHLKYYTKGKYIKNALKKGIIYQVDANTYRLSIQGKQNILLNNIFGVDIDSQAVEVTKLSLLLKLMEDENIQSAGQLFKYSDLKLLPDLKDNIKCGNSLIGTDFYKDKQLELFSKDELRKINAFDWEVEFKDIMDSGGFDCVIGNPPYVKNENLNEDLKLYARRNYYNIDKFFDIYQLFLEKSYLLITKKGFFSFIIPSLFLKGLNYKETRKFFLEKTSIRIIKDFGDGVFKNVQMPTCIIVFQKSIEKNQKIIFYKRDFYNNFTSKNLDKINLLRNQNYIYDNDEICLKLISKNPKLGSICRVTRGLEIGRNKIIIEKGINILFGQDIERYNIKRISVISKAVYEKYIKKASIFENKKIVIRETGKQIIATYDDSGLITNRSLYCIRTENVNIKYLLGIINSKLTQYFYVHQFRSDTGVFPKIRIEQVKEIPINIINLNNNKQHLFEKNIIKYVNEILVLKKELITSTHQNAKIIILKINLLDKQIDQLVYELYGLSDEEIKIVEGK